MGCWKTYTKFTISDFSQFCLMSRDKTGWCAKMPSRPNNLILWLLPWPKGRMWTWLRWSGYPPASNAIGKQITYITQSLLPVCELKIPKEANAISVDEPLISCPPNSNLWVHEVSKCFQNLYSTNKTEETHPPYHLFIFSTLYKLRQSLSNICAHELFSFLFYSSSLFSF